MRKYAFLFLLFAMSCSRQEKYVRIADCMTPQGRVQAGLVGVEAYHGTWVDSSETFLSLEIPDQGILDVPARNCVVFKVPNRGE